MLVRKDNSRTIGLLVLATLLVMLVMPSFAGAVAAKYPIRPGVKLQIPTADGMRTVSLSRLTKSEALAKLQRYTFRGSPKTVRIKDRGIVYTVSLKGIVFKPTYRSMLDIASTTATSTVATVPYLTKSVRAKVAAKVERWSARRYVKTKTVSLSNGARLSKFGGHRIDEDATTKRVLTQIKEFALSHKKSIDVVSAKTDNPTPVVKNNRGRVLVVSKLQRRVYLLNNNKVVVSYPIAIGTSSYPTPTGYFVIARKAVNPTWNNPGSSWASGMPASLSGASSPLGARALYLYSNGRDTGIRFHGTTAAYSIGTAASHGCMRMYNSDVKKLYEKVPVGTRVYIYK